jgi:hypothetical protein|nr:MAG TPA: Putative acetylornithine deacetylase [Caudoviricetes sp.]
MRGYIPEPSLDEPEKDEMPRCPCCGWECSTLYRARGGEIVGCENCIDALDAVDNRDLAD